MKIIIDVPDEAYTQLRNSPQKTQALRLIAMELAQDDTIEPVLQTIACAGSILLGGILRDSQTEAE